MRPRSLVSRRRFVLLGCVAAAGALVQACGGAASPTSAPAKPSDQPKPAAATKPADAAKPAVTTGSAPAGTPAAAVQAKPGGGATLQYWSFFPSDNTRWAERPIMFAEFEQKTSSKIEVNFVDFGQLDAKVQTGFAAKQLPDLIDPGITQMTIGWGRQGILIELNDVLAKLGKDDFARPLVTALTYKGKLYGIPWQANPQMMFYRKDWAAEKGLKIGNWDEWLTFAKTFTGKNPAGKDGYGQGGFYAPVHQSPWVQNWLGPNGGLTFDEKWSVV